MLYTHPSRNAFQLQTFITLLMDDKITGVVRLVLSSYQVAAAGKLGMSVSLYR